MVILHHHSNQTKDLPNIYTVNQFIYLKADFIFFTGEMGRDFLITMIIIIMRKINDLFAFFRTCLHKASHEKDMLSSCKMQVNHHHHVQSKTLLQAYIFFLGMQLN